MKEYIEREPVAIFVEECGCSPTWIAKRIRNHEAFPAADVAPVRHGRWKNGGNGLYDTCSACEKEIYLAIPMNYCPECGALMDGKEDEYAAD